MRIAVPVEAAEGGQTGGDAVALPLLCGCLGVDVDGAGGRAEPDAGGYVLHAGSARPLLIATHEEGAQAETAPDEERAGTRRPAELVRRDRHQIGAEVGETDRHVAGRGAAST